MLPVLFALRNLLRENQTIRTESIPVPYCVRCFIGGDMCLGYPVDLTRVYLAGHSHNGGFALACARKFPDKIAAIGTLGNYAGFWPEREMGPETMVVEDEEIEYMRKNVDVPTVNIVGCCEHMCEYPMYQDQEGNDLDSKLYHWNRRMRAYRCRELTREDILAAKDSDDYIERVLGVPADWTECLYMDGAENYIADFVNDEGNRHLRQIGMGNLPHTVTPLMCDLVWNFVRRFAKDPNTGKCVQLF